MQGFGLGCTSDASGDVANSDQRPLSEPMTARPSTIFGVSGAYSTCVRSRVSEENEKTKIAPKLAAAPNQSKLLICHGSLRGVAPP